MWVCQSVQSKHTNPQRLELVQLLMQRYNMKASAVAHGDGGFVLLFAAQEGFTDVVRELVEKGGADVNQVMRGCFGVTALQMAAQNGHLETVKYLVEKGADVNSEDDRGDGPLRAAERNKQRCLAYLREKGATQVQIAYVNSRFVLERS